MPKTTQTIMLTYWRLSHAGDESTVPEMRAAATQGVTHAIFKTAKRESMLMTFLAEIGDDAAIDVAIEYAKRNLYRSTLRANVLDLKVFVNETPALP